MWKIGICTHVATLPRWPCLFGPASRSKRRLRECGGAQEWRPMNAVTNVQKTGLTDLWGTLGSSPAFWGCRRRPINIPRIRDCPDNASNQPPHPLRVAKSPLRVQIYYPSCRAPTTPTPPILADGGLEPEQSLMSLSLDSNFHAP